MKKYFYAMVALSLPMMLNSCEEYDNAEKNYVEKEYVQEAVYDTSSRISAATYIINGGPEYVDQALRQRCQNIVGNLDEAKIVVLSSDELEKNSEAYAQFFNNGGIIVEVNPDMEKHAQWFEQFGLVTLQTDKKYTLVATHGGNTYLLDDIFEETAFVNDAPEQTSPESEEEGERINSDLQIMMMEKNADYVNINLNRFVEWINDNSKVMYQSNTDPAIPGTVEELAKLIDDQNFTQHFTTTHRYEYKNYQICKVMWSDPDKVTRSGSFDLDVYVTPYYAYNETNQPGVGGDYYFVRTRINTHNKNMYGLYKEWHGAVRTWAHIFYLNELSVVSTPYLIKNPDGYEVNMPLTSSDVEFFNTPVPTTTSNSTTYTSGFTKALNISGQGGVNGGKLVAQVTVGGTWTWSDSRSVAISDLKVEMNTGERNRSVHHKYILCNVQEEDETNDAVPAIGRTDRIDESSWCWHIKFNNDDNVKTNFGMTLKTTTVFGYEWRHATWNCEGEHSSTSKTFDDVIVFKAPNRMRSGCIELNSTQSTGRYITNLAIRKVSNDEVVATFKGASGTDNKVLRQVNVGKYNVTYDIVNGDTRQKIGSYILRDVEVNTCETTVLNSFDGERIDE